MPMHFPTDAMSAVLQFGATPTVRGMINCYERYGFFPWPIKGGEDPPNPDDKPDDKPEDKPSDDKMELGEAGKKAIKDERDARRAAEKRLKDAEDRLSEIDRAKAQADEDEAKAKGEYEKLAEERGTKLAEATAQAKTLTEERDALLAQVTAYEDRDRQRIKEGSKDLPEDLAAFDPGEDVPLTERLKWFDKATAMAAKRQTDPIQGNGRLPDKLKGDPKADEAARRSQAQLARNF